MKRCPGCKEELDRSLFYRNKRMSDGLACWCIKCTKEKGPAFSKKYYDKLLNVDPKMYKLKTMIKTSKERATKQNVPFSIDLEYLISILKADDSCPVLGIKLDWNCRKISKDNSPTLDKIIPHLGYIKGNVAVISKIANTIKSNGTSQQIFAVANWVKTNEFI